MMQNRFFYIFGPDEQYPYNRGYIEVRAYSREYADKKFRKRFPDRYEGVLNCAAVYDEQNFKRLMEHLVEVHGLQFLEAEKCIEVIR